MAQQKFTVETTEPRKLGNAASYSNLPADTKSVERTYHDGERETLEAQTLENGIIYTGQWLNG